MGKTFIYIVLFILVLFLAIKLSWVGLVIPLILLGIMILGDGGEIGGRAEDE